MHPVPDFSTFFFFNDTATTEIYTLSLHDALPIWQAYPGPWHLRNDAPLPEGITERLRALIEAERSEEHTSELQSPCNLVCRLLLEKKKNKLLREHRHAYTYTSCMSDTQHDLLIYH